MRVGYWRHGLRFQLDYSNPFDLASRLVYRRLFLESLWEKENPSEYDSLQEKLAEVMTVESGQPDLSQMLKNLQFYSNRIHKVFPAESDELIEEQKRIRGLVEVLENWEDLKSGKKQPSQLVLEQKNSGDKVLNDLLTHVLSEKKDSSVAPVSPSEEEVSKELAIEFLTQPDGGCGVATALNLPISLGIYSKEEISSIDDEDPVIFSFDFFLQSS